MTEIDAQILSISEYQGKKANAEHLDYVRYLQTTKAHEHYYQTMARLAERFGPAPPELIARPILRLVVSEDQQ